MANTLMFETSVNNTDVPVKKFDLFFASVASFAIIYNITFRFSEVLTSGRIAAGALLIWSVYSNLSAWKEFDKKLLIIFIPVPYVILLFIFVGDPGQISRFFHLALFSYVSGAIIAKMSGNLKYLLIIFLLAILFQSIIIIIIFINPQYRIFIESYILIGGNFDASNLYRGIGLTSNTGSSLSIVQSLGVLCGGFLLLIRQKLASHGEVILIISSMLTCLISCAFVGRTGLYISIFFICSFSYFAKKLNYLFSFFILFSLFFAFGNLSWIENLIPPEVSFDWLTNWMMGILSEDDQTFAAIDSMPIPAIDELDSWIGHGLVNIVNGVNPSGHDSGFIQTYYSIGLIFTIIMYSAYFYILVRILRWLPSYLAWSLAIIFFTLELKEPFLFKYSLVFVLIAIYSITSNSKVSIQTARIHV